MAEQGDLVTFTITAKNRGQQATVNGQVWDIVPDYLEILEVEAVGEHKGLKVHETSGQTVRVDTGILGQGAEITILIRTRFRPLGTLPTEAGPADPTSTGKEVPAPALLCVQNVAHFTADNCPDRRAEAEPCLLPTAGAPDAQWGLVAGLATCVLVLSLALSKRGRIERPRQP
jgi:uncharacterized repeat protein (TIGR01451 family)